MAAVADGGVIALRQAQDHLVHACLLGRRHDRCRQELERLRRLKDEGFDSVGVITRTRAEAETLYRALAKDFSLHTLLGAEDEFPKGAVVLPVYLAKGLEFDAVILTDASAEHYSLEEDRNLLYVACTRALHMLTVLYSGAPSPLLPR